MSKHNLTFQVPYTQGTHIWAHRPIGIHMYIKKKKKSQQGLLTEASW